MGGPRPVNGTLILVLGIVGLLCCQIVSPVAWVMGNQALKTLDAEGGDPSQRGLVVAGRILGIIGTVVLILSLIWMFFFGGLAMLTALQQGPGAFPPPGGMPPPGGPPR